MNAKCFLDRSPLVSIVITCFNYGKFIKQAIDSALEQTYSSVEIVIVNDGSTDNTDEVVANYLNLDNVKYIKQQNAGQTKAKNTGINNSSGDFIAFLDADDAWETEKLAKQVILFSNEAVGVVYSRSRYIDEQGNAFYVPKSGNKYLLPKRGKVTDHLLLDNFVPFSSSIVRRGCFDRCGVFDESLQMGIDWDLWLRLSTIYEFDFVDEPLLIYRVGHAGQMSKNLELRQRCSDRIMSKFIEKNQAYISQKIVRKAYSYTYCNRGDYHRAIDWKKSVLYYLKAIWHNPGEMLAYRGLLETFAYCINFQRSK